VEVCGEKWKLSQDSPLIFLFELKKLASTSIFLKIENQWTSNFDILKFLGSKNLLILNFDSTIFVNDLTTRWIYHENFLLDSLNWFLCWGLNDIKLANDITLEKQCMSFWPKIFFSYKWFFEQLFLQIVTINVHNCLCTWHVFKK
jgi:hypothetical protein